VEANSTGGQGSRRAVESSDDDDDDDDMFKATTIWLIGSRFHDSFLLHFTHVQMLSAKSCTGMLSYGRPVLHFPCKALYRAAHSSVWCNSLAKLPVSF
jgi:hypothetical protein